jgi:hypothetical protein
MKVDSAGTLAQTTPSAAHARLESQFYDEEVPPFAEEGLAQLYQCPMSTLARFAIYDAAPQASTWVERQGGEIVTVLLFRRTARHVLVYNEQVSLDHATIERFAQAVFARFAAVTRIGFYAIAVAGAVRGYPMLRRECLEDIALALPATPDAYLTALGPNTRGEIRRCMARIKRDFPSFRFETYAGIAVTEAQVREVIAFNHARLGAKNQASYYDERAIGRLVRWVHAHGRVGIATIDGRTCGGVICLTAGAHMMMQAVAHDPCLDAYRLGKLCCYLSICDAIAQGARTYHLGWGRYDYKFRLLGRLEPLYRVELYRSRLHMLFDARHLARVELGARRRAVKLRIACAREGRGRGARALLALAALRRAARRLLRRGHAG